MKPFPSSQSNRLSDLDRITVGVNVNPANMVTEPDVELSNKHSSDHTIKKAFEIC